MTVKELARSIGVSKPTIAKAMSELNIKAAMVGNRYELTDEQCSIIKSKLLQKPQDNEAQEPQAVTEDTAKPQTVTQETQTETEKAIIEILREQLAEKDRQIADLNAQIVSLTEMLKASQDRQTELTTALSTAQALHAGTIKQIGTMQKQGFFSRLFRKNEQDKGNTD